MTDADYRYRLYKRGGMWLVLRWRENCTSFQSSVHGPFLGIGNAWDWTSVDVRIRIDAL